MNNESENDPGSEKPAGHTIGVWMTIAFWICFLGFAAVGAQRLIEERRAANPPRIVSQNTNNKPTILIEGTRRGHYRVQGLVNGYPVDFLVDTGATEVSIPADVAARIGLERGAASLAITANGTATIYDTEIQSLSIGPLQRFNVPAHISPGLVNSDALLGMSFLRHFNLAQEDNRLQINEP